MRTHLLRALAGTGLIFAILLAPDRALAGAEPQARFFFNHPHAVPPDYVYRTARLFPPPTADAATPPAISPEKGGELLPLAGGSILNARIAELTRQLLGSVQEELDERLTTAVSSFVNLNQLYTTSALGRYLSEQFMGELQRAGMEVIELRKMPAIMIDAAGGEYVLSRDMDQLAFVHPVQIILAGTYTVADGELFLNVRLLRNQGGKVLASASLVAPMDGVIRGLLADEAAPAGPGTPVRITGARK